MSQVIIYSQENGVVAVIYPAPAALEVMSIEEIAEKDVPTGLPFKIIDSSELPTDRISRMAWTVDAEDLTDGVGA